MTVDEALKYIISMGVVAPPAHMSRVVQPAPQVIVNDARNQHG
jgi:uncharacterized membrane protein